MIVWLCGVSTSSAQQPLFDADPGMAPPTENRDVPASPFADSTGAHEPPGFGTPAASVEDPPEPPIPSRPPLPPPFASSSEQPSGDGWQELLYRLEQAEQRLAQLEEERVEWLRSLSSDASPTAEDVEHLDPDFLTAFRDALENHPRTSPTVNVTGQLQIDMVTFNQEELNRETIGDLRNATGFRRARLGAFGEIFQTVEYRIEWDFASVGRPRFLDNWIAVKGLPFINNVIVGHFFEPFSLERYTPNRFITFLERSSVDVFAPARNMGAMTFGHSEDENVIWAFGIFQSTSNQYGDWVGDSGNFAGTGHVTWLPIFDPVDERYMVHLGASATYRAIGEKEVRFTKRPENELQAFGEFGQPTFADTGPIASDAFQMLGLEFATVYGPFSLQSEVVYTHVERLDDARNAHFHAWYVFGSWFLTGENRSYDRTTILGRFREGIFQRIETRTNAFKGPVDDGAPRGIGAWELAVRYSVIDLDSRDISGNRVETVTLGLNWYLNNHTRVQWNYKRPLTRSREFGNSTADIFGMRFGFEF
jgi:phosphate-selective porin OprO and OprP